MFRGTAAPRGPVPPPSAAHMDPPITTSSGSGLFAELRRRKVFQAAAVYLAVAFIVAQVADIVAPGLNLPAWTVTFVLFLLILGFPVVVALAWVFDVTPTGVQRTSAAAGVSSAGRREPVRGHALGRAEERRFDSIAVLPFVDMSPNGDQEYFSDGITEELLNALAKVPGLRVPARTSSFAFKKQNVDIREIGAKLDVDTVLEGSVRMWEGELAITAQLIEVETGYHLWSETYDRRLAEVFRVQREISRTIVETLRGRFAGGGDTIIPARSGMETSDPEVYQVYLRGRYFWNQRTHDSLLKARDLFEQAIAMAPAYAPAHAGLADALYVLVHYRMVPAREAVDRVRAAAERAVSLADELDEAHVSLAAARQLEWRWVDAEREFRRALELNPQSSRALHWYGVLLAYTGRGDEGMVHLRRALELDPLSLAVRSGIGAALMWLGRGEESRRESLAMLELVPDHPVALGNLSIACSAMGDHDEAIAAAERLGRGDPTLLARIGFAYAIAGRTREAEAILAEIDARAAVEHVALMNIGKIHLALGDHERALDLLERALEEERDPEVAQAAASPFWSPLRDHPRFRAVLARMNLTPRMTATWPERAIHPADVED
jgi:TolB-like protein/tetratricopeptide (TPR) repeat protein